MFKKFNPKEDVAGQSQLKSSVQRAIRQQILTQFPMLEPYMEHILPKKQNLVLVKCAEHVTMIAVNDVPLFFNVRQGPWFPLLRVLHLYPTALPRMQVDRGAIKFVLQGANIMCPGLTSAGGSMADVEAETPVAIFAEGKQFALAVGITKMSTKEIRSVNKGIAIEVLHHLGDGLWHCPSLA